MNLLSSDAILKRSSAPHLNTTAAKAVWTIHYVCPHPAAPQALQCRAALK